MFAVSCGDDPVGPEGDTTPPTVSSTSPANTAADVDIDADLVVVFSEPISQTSVTSSTFQLSGGMSGIFSFSGNNVTLEPSSSLEYETTYTATLTTGVKDTAGNGLAQNYSWTFTTEDDPANLPPTVTSTSPAGNAADISVSTNITATFSKPIDAATLTTSSFTVNNGVTGTVSYLAGVAAFTPDSDLNYSTTYTATITTAVADTAGNNMTAAKVWSFTTQADPMIPVVNVTYPFNNAIIGDTVTIQVAAIHPVGVDSVAFFIDEIRVASDTDEPFTFQYDATGLTVASYHSIRARAYESEGRVGVSEQTSFVYLWQEMKTDGNFEQLPLDCRRMLARSTDSLLELRYEFSADWGDAINDTALDMGIYFDSDQYSGTGRRDFDTKILNDIGAEYRAVIGIHGLDAFATWTGTEWQVLYDPSGFAYIILPDSSRAFEVGIKWSDMGLPDAVDIVSINLFWQSTEAYVADWIPDQNLGHVTVERGNRYIGEGYASPPATGSAKARVVNSLRTNPFE